MTRNEARKAVICPCHDVTVGDIEDAIDHGHTDPETIKRATAVYMGACQGKFCSPLVQRILRERGVERAGEQRRPAARVPVVPIALGALIAPETAIETETAPETATETATETEPETATANEREAENRGENASAPDRPAPDRTPAHAPEREAR